MFRSYKKDIEKIYQRIDKVAKVGRDNNQEYYNLVDDLISKSQYGLLTQVLLIKYNFDSTKYLSVEDMKGDSWKSILFLTNSKIQDDLEDFKVKLGIYQIGLDYFRNVIIDDEIQVIKLGSINEVDTYVNSISPLAYTNNEFQQLSKNKQLELVVSKVGELDSVVFSDWNSERSYDKNVTLLYRSAIEYLVSI